MIKANIVNTLSFRLLLLYIALFMFSFIVIGLAVYHLTQNSLEQQLKSNVKKEVSRLKSEYDNGGMHELISELNEIDELHSGTLTKYGLIDHQGHLLAGSFREFEPRPGWQIIKYTNHLNPIDNTLYTHVIPIEMTWFGVGQSSLHINKTSDAIIQAFLWGMGLVLALSLLGGWYMSRKFVYKIKNIASSAEMIIAGDLTQRLPISSKQDELDRLAHVLNRMLDKIAMLIEDIKQVSNDIAHDLRTPIGHLKFRLEEIANSQLSEDQYRERITLASQSVDEILTTFSAMLRIAQIESGSRRSGFKTVNFSEILETVTDSLLLVAEDQQKTITKNITENVLLTGDKELLIQMIFNLLDNAIVHTPAFSQITVSLLNANNLVQLEISDNGPGISEAHRHKVTQRFFRLESSRSTPGNGLGLNIVSAIVALHSGTLELSDNHPGLKATVSFSVKTRVEAVN